MTLSLELDADGSKVIAFTTARVRATMLSADDADMLSELHRDTDVMIYVGGVKDQDENSQWLQANLSHWHDHGFGQWRLQTHEGQDLGRGGLRWIDKSVGEPLVEVGYVLHRQAWGHGYATEACRAFMHAAADAYGITELGGITMAGNDASTRVLEKCGFVFERWFEHPGGRCKFLRYRRPA